MGLAAHPEAPQARDRLQGDRRQAGLLVRGRFHRPRDCHRRVRLRTFTSEINITERNLKILKPTHFYGHLLNTQKKILAHMTRTRVHSPTRSPHPLSLIRTIDPAAHCLLGTYYRGQGEGRGRGNRLCLVFSLSAVGLTLGCDSLPRRVLLLTACITALFFSLVHRSILGRLLP